MLERFSPLVPRLSGTPPARAIFPTGLSLPPNRLPGPSPRQPAHPHIRGMALTLVAVLATMVTVATLAAPLAAFEVPGLGGADSVAGDAALPALEVTHIAPAKTGFKPASVVSIKIGLPDEALVPGQVYTASVTWMVPPKHHLNGGADDPAITHIDLRLLGDALETAKPGFTGSLHPPEIEGLAPYFLESKVTGLLQFRVKRGLPADTPLTATLEIDSSFCSEKGLCYEFACTPTSGQRYTVQFTRAATEAAADAAFAEPRKPPLASAATATPPVPPTTPVNGVDTGKLTTFTPVEGQFKEPKDAKITVVLPQEPLIPGKRYDARVTWTVGEKFHVNGPMPGDPTAPASRFTLTSTDKDNDLEFGTLVYDGKLLPNPIEGAGPYFAEKTVTATLPFRVKSATAAGLISSRLDIDTSYCAEAGICYYYTHEMKRGESYAVTFTVGGPAVTPEPLPAAGDTTAPPTPSPTAPAAAAPTTAWAIAFSNLPMDQKVQQLYKVSGIWVLFLFVLAFGMITTGLPCTYPLIPITSRILGAQAPGKTPQPGDPTRGDAFAASLFYVFGLTLIYGIIGGLGAQGGRLITTINNTAWFNDGIALLFVVLALAMYGWFEIKVPLFIANKLQGGGGPGAPRKAGMLGNALRGLSMGTFAAILAGACTAPVVIAAILLISKLNLGFGMGFLILAPFGLGFGIPYFLLTNFVSKFPAPGAWMNLLKIAFGTVILLFAFYFWNNTVPNPTAFATVLGIALISVGIGFGALDRREPPVPVTDRVQQIVTIGLAVAGGFFLVVGLRHMAGLDTSEAPMVANGPGSTLTAAAVNWEPYAGFDPAKPAADGRPVFIFFHSPSCQYCKKMLATGFRDPKVIALTQNVRMIDADAINPDDPKLVALQDHYKFFAQPTCVFLTATHAPAFGDESVVAGYLDTEALQQHFENLLTK